MDKRKNLRKLGAQKEFGCAVHYWQLESAISRGSAGSEWGLQILKYADDFKLNPPRWLPPWPDTDFQTRGNPHISDSGRRHIKVFSQKRSHMPGLRGAFLGGSIQTSKPFTWEISGKGSEGEKGTGRKREMHARVCLWVRTCMRSECVVKEKKRGERSQKKGGTPASPLSKLISKYCSSPH